MKEENAMRVEITGTVGGFTGKPDAARLIEALKEFPAKAVIELHIDTSYSQFPGWFVTGTWGVEEKDE